MVNVFLKKQDLSGKVFLGIAFWLFKDKQYNIDYRTFNSKISAENYLIGTIIDHVTATVNDIILVDTSDDFSLTETKRTIRDGLRYMIDHRNQPDRVFQCAWSLRNYLQDYIRKYPHADIPAGLLMVQTVKQLSYEYHARIQQDKILAPEGFTCPE